MYLVDFGLGKILTELQGAGRTIYVWWTRKRGHLGLRVLFEKIALKVKYCCCMSIRTNFAKCDFYRIYCALSTLRLARAV